MDKIWKGVVSNARELAAISRAALKKAPTDKDWKRIHAANLAHLKKAKASAEKFGKHH